MNGDVKVKIPLYEAKTGNLKLDSTGVIQYIDSIDSLILAPNETSQGSFDGAKDKNGNYFKVTARNTVIDFEVNDKSLKVIGTHDFIVNWCGDCYKKLANIVKGLKGESKKILSGFKKAGSLDAKRLSGYWDKSFTRDCGATYDEWVASIILMNNSV